MDLNYAFVTYVNHCPLGPSCPPLAADIAIALVVLAAHSAPFLLTTRAADPVTGYTLSQYLPVLGQALPLIWRRRAPLPVLVVVMAAGECTCCTIPTPRSSRSRTRC
ncbi:hypothetical protein ACFQX6_31615 [Streptosporangium lutulentum]